MRTLSTGQPSTLGSYKELARFFGPKAVALIDKKIEQDPDGENAEVLADEPQMMLLLQAASQSETPST